MLRVFCFGVVVLFAPSCGTLGPASHPPGTGPAADTSSVAGVAASWTGENNAASGTATPITSDRISQTFSFASDSADAAAARAVADRAMRASQHGDEAYRIGTFDVLKISVFKVPDLSKTLQVSEAGTINFPLIGEIDAAGRTTRELESILASALEREYLQNPQVAVQVTAYNSQRITVDGAVNQPGVYPLTGPITLLQAIATAKGLNSSADTRVIVFRDTQAGRRAARFDLQDIRGGSSPDPQLKAGDVIIANDSASKKTLEAIFKVLPIAQLFLLL